MESPAEDESPESAAPPPEDPYRSERPERARVQPLPKAAASLDLRVRESPLFELTPFTNLTASRITAELA